MNPLPVLNVRGLLRQYGIHPDKSLGQNFLIEDAALRKILRIADTTAQDTVLEIGPGLGSLTRYLADSAQQVIAVELDPRLVAPLKEVLSPYNNVHIIEGDILQIDLNKTIEADTYLVVANIPYYITSQLIRHLLEAKHKPTRLVLTVQKEVAERICASPDEMSLLALSVQVYGSPQIQAQIPAGAFYPSPKIDSAVVRVDLYPSPLIPPDQLNSFFRLAKAGFSQKRKTLRNALAGGMAWSKSKTQSYLQAASIDPNRRAETLDLSEWERLVIQVTHNPNP